MKKLVLLLAFYSMTFYSFGQIDQSQAIDSIFAEWDKEDVPGCALGIIKEGELIYAKGYGLANMEYGIPNSASSVFRIASTSKQFTAACIILLVEKGKLKLDDNLKSIFPEFPDYAEKITVRHLLNHTSGIRDYLQLAYLKGLGEDDYYVDEDIMEWLVNQSDLNFKPGKEYLYSNSGYWLLGQIVNETAGMNMADFAEKELFKPLGMTNTHFHNDHNRIVKNRASGYTPVDENNFEISMTTLEMIGDGGIFTTIDDIKKWDDAFYDSTVLSRAFWQKMTQQGVLNNGKVIDYACGLSISEYKGLKTIRHGGAFVGYRAELLRFPEEKLSIAIFANRADASPSRKANQVADIMLKNKLTEKADKNKKESTVKIPEPAREFELTQLAGSYEIEPGATFIVNVKNDTLKVVQSWNKSAYDLVKMKGNTFKIPEVKTITFTFSDLKDDLTQTLTVVQNGRKTKVKRKKEVDFSGVDINDYAGSYYSKELDVTYHFVIEDEVLKVRVEDTRLIMDCTMSKVDEFVMEFGSVNFQRTKGEISGFELDSGRVNNLKFSKK